MMVVKRGFRKIASFGNNNALFRQSLRHCWPAMLHTENYRVSAIAEASLASVAPHHEFPSFSNCQGIAGQRWSALRLTELRQLPTELY